MGIHVAKHIKELRQPALIKAAFLKKAQRNKRSFISPFWLHIFRNNAITLPLLLLFKKTCRCFVADVILNPVIYKFLHFNKMVDLEKRVEVNIH